MRVISFHSCIPLLRLTLPIFSSSTTSSLLSSQRSRQTGRRSMAPDLTVTGSSEWYWCIISSCMLGKGGPSKRKCPSPVVCTMKCLCPFQQTLSTIWLSSLRMVSRTRKSPSLFSRRTTSSRGRTPWNHSSSYSGRFVESEICKSFREGLV